MAIRGILALLHDRRGNVLPLAAIGMLLSAAIVGGGIDMSRAYRVQNRLQSACDAGALAGRRAVTTNGFANNGPEQAQANAYFNTNFDTTSLEAVSTTKSFSSSDNGQTIVGTASAQLNLAVMKIFGFQKFTLSVNCSASMGVGNSDVMMVLDTTGSMSSALGTTTRIDALRTAMKNFYTTVQAATGSTNARIRYGFVPYSSTVNVGRLLDPSYLSDTWGYQTRIATQIGASYTVDTSLTSGTKTDYGTTTYGNDSTCGNAVPATTPWTNYGAESNLGTTSTTNNGSGDQRWTTTIEQPQQRTVYECYKKTNNSPYRIRTYTQYQDHDTNTNWKWTYKQVVYDVSAYKAFNTVTSSTGSYGGTVSSTWNGCIEERGVQFATSPNTSPSSTYSYSSTNGFTPYAWDLDIDAAPTSTDAKSVWGPMWPQIAYYRYSYVTSSDTGNSASSACPRQAQLLATMTQSEFNAVADSLTPNGGTYLDVGMVWGGRLSSPDGMFASNVNIAPSNGGEVSRHIIFMTDGDMDPSQQYLSAWGIEFNDHRVTNDGVDSTDKARHTSRFLAICEAIKAKGIRIWSISFTSGSSSATILQTCASPNSYYNADDSAALNAAFQEIAKQVGELRITQ